ncbi:beta-lactamase domain-containing protein 2 [Patella vulgata]|uniref:beta-lactamase domain-containing protein 2 n=1 Tax=Patella vulgata TaxID=6465 RepID=UPI0024A7F4DB|nr:beta-lactamase domain-containing protein 2 [Patella vulgata]
MKEKSKILLPGGFVKPGFEEVKEIFRENLATGLEKGGSFAAYYQGELVVNIWGGEADPLCKRQWKKDTVSCFYSTTKSLSSVVIAHLVDKGCLNYEDVICKHWPEFAQNGKENITLEQFVSNKAGLPGCETPFDLAWLKDNPRKLGHILAEQKPLWLPGKYHGYHPYTFALYLDQIVRRVDPKFRSLSKYFEEEIAQPFGLDLYIGLPKPLQYRCARIAAVNSYVQYKESMLDTFKGDIRVSEITQKNPRDWKHINTMNDTDFMDIPCGSTHGFGTAVAMAKFHSILADGGSLNGKRLLSESLIQRFQKPLSWGIDLTYGMEDIYSLGATVIPALEANKVTYQHL